MNMQYPDIQLHLVEGLSGHLARMLNARQLDLAVLTDTSTSDARRLSQNLLWREKLFLVQSALNPAMEAPSRLRLRDVAQLPLILPSASHGLRSVLQSAFDAAGLHMGVVAEIDSLPLLLEAVEQGLGCTLQPWSAMGRYPDASKRFRLHEVRDARAQRDSTLCSLSDDELSPAGLATRNMVAACASELIQSGRWRGASIGTQGHRPG